MRTPRYQDEPKEKTPKLRAARSVKIPAIRKAKAAAALKPPKFDTGNGKKPKRSY